MRNAGFSSCAAVGDEQRLERPPGARHRCHVLVAVALDELAALAAQLAPRNQHGRDLPGPRQHALALERVAEVGERLRVAAQLVALGMGARRVERHGDVVGAAQFEDHLAEHVERAPHLLVIVDLVEARQDREHGAPLRLDHALARGDETVHRPADGDEQQAQVDEDGDAQRDVVALRQAGGLLVERAQGRRVLDRLHGPLLQRAQLVGTRAAA